MRRPLRTAALLGACGLALCLSACGAGEEAEAVASLKAEVVSNNAMTGSAELSDKEATCVAKGTVDEIGVDELRDYGVLGDDLEVDKQLSQVRLSSRDAQALAAVYVRCTPAVDVTQDRLVEVVAPKKPGPDRIRAESCVREAATPEVVTDILAENFAREDATAYAALRESLQACAPSASR